MELQPKMEERGKGGMVGWLLQRLAAAIIVVIVTVHLLAIHYHTPGQPITFAESVERLRSPLFLGLWLTLLAAGLFHAIYGLRGIVLDFVKVKNPSALTWSLAVMGAIVFVLGVLVLLPLILDRPLSGS